MGLFVPLCLDIELVLAAEYTLSILSKEQSRDDIYLEDQYFNGIYLELKTRVSVAMATYIVHISASYRLLLYCHFLVYISGTMMNPGLKETS